MVRGLVEKEILMIACIFLVLVFLGIYKMLTYKNKGPTNSSGSGPFLFPMGV